MKKTIIYLGITFFAFSSLSFASNMTTNTIQKAQNTYMETPAPLALAISKGEIVTVKSIIEKGANINEKLNGKTPLMYAARYNKVEIIEYLLSKGADRAIKDSFGYTALNYAEVSNAYEAMTVLKAPIIDKQMRISSIDTYNLLDPEPVSFVNTPKTDEQILASSLQIIECTDTDEVQPLDFEAIDNKSEAKKLSSSQSFVTIY